MDPALLEKFELWPEAPKARTELPHSGLDPEIQAMLEEKGWRPIDVRSLEKESDADRAKVLKLWLEGLRLGTIVDEGNLQKILDAEMRLLTSKNLQNLNDDKNKIKKRTLDEILNFGWGTLMKDPLAPAPRPRPGRKPKQGTLDDE